MANEEIPTEFSGLVYAPGTENEVYMLTAFLWQYLPYRIAFEEFEVDPKRRGYRHSKWLDAKGRKLVDGKWEDITIEFKLYSSGFLRDLEKYPELKVDKVNLIICWWDDVSGVRDYVDDVIALKSIFFSLPEDERKCIILHPNKTSKVSEDSSITNLLLRFSEANRPKVEELCRLWLQQAQAEAQGGRAEILFPRGARTILRACAYSVEHIIVTEYISQYGRGAILSRFKGEQLTSNQISVPLANIELSTLREFLDMLGIR